MTEEGRLQDWIACGGQENGNFGFWTKQHQRPEETDKETEDRVNVEFQRCMLRKEYRYIGRCDSEYIKTRPLCGIVP